MHIFMHQIEHEPLDSFPISPICLLDNAPRQHAVLAVLQSQQLPVLPTATPLPWLPLCIPVNTQPAARPTFLSPGISVPHMACINRELLGGPGDTFYPVDMQLTARSLFLAAQDSSSNRPYVEEHFLLSRSLVATVISLLFFFFFFLPGKIHFLPKYDNGATTSSSHLSGALHFRCSIPERVFGTKEAEPSRTLAAAPAWG